MSSVSPAATESVIRGTGVDTSSIKLSLWLIWTLTFAEDPGLHATSSYALETDWGGRIAVAAEDVDADGFPGEAPQLTATPESSSPLHTKEDDVPMRLSGVAGVVSQEPWLTSILWWWWCRNVAACWKCPSPPLLRHFSFCLYWCCRCWW